MPSKKWSGQNLTGQTVGSGPGPAFQLMQAKVANGEWYFKDEKFVATKLTVKTTKNIIHTPQKFVSIQYSAVDTNLLNIDKQVKNWR